MSLPDPTYDPEFYDHLLPKRFLAWVVDLVITLLLVLIAIIATGFLGLFIFPVLWTAVAVGYRTVMLTRYGATAGMMIASLQWLNLDGERPEAVIAAWHSFIYAVCMAMMAPQIVSVTMMLTTPYRQGLNDWILRTTIINRYATR